MGSLVSPSRLRFDFSHFSSLDPNQIDEIEDLVNEQIRADFEVTAFEEEIAAAKQMGARALFGEKYGDRVRVVKIADFSLELCGGTHVKTTGQIGMLSFVSEGGIAAGTRRAEALTGIEAIRATRFQRHEIAALRALMNSTPGELSHDVSSLLESNRELERKLAEARRGAAGQTAIELIATAVDVGDVRVVAARVEVSDADSMRSMADGLRGQLGTGAAVLGSILEGKVTFIAVVTDDLAKTGALKAGDIVREVAQLAGGSGGGKPHMAQAGGGDADKLDGALAATEQIVRARLGK
jgi:alanyl-tRNA synthetase